MSATRRFSSQLRSYLATHPYTIAGAQHRITEWADTVFTQATPRTIATHMGREVVEVQMAAHTYQHYMSILSSEEGQSVARAALAEELADVMHMVFHLASVADIDMAAAIERKFEKNQRRTWKEPDHEGVVEHDKEG